MNALMPYTAEHSRPREPRRRSRFVRLELIAFVLVLALGTGLRLWHLSSSPAWQWDEAVYWRVSVSVQHGALAEHSLWSVPWQPFLYQPPFYFLLLSRWFDAFGASIYHARVLGVISTAAMLAVLGRLLWKIHGSRVALFAMIPVVLDGWLMYIERVSYIENVLILLIVSALLAYQRALERPSWMRFAVAGLAVGLAADFKQTGAYTVLAVLLCWLVTRRSHRGHLVLLGFALAMVAAYLVVMTRLFDVPGPGRDWFLNQSLVQVRRVLGLQQSGGTLTSPLGVLHLLAAQYRYFVPSVLIGAAAIVILVRRVVQCYRARSWSPALDNALLFSWLAAGVLVFGVSALKFPQYFALILIPAYCFGWTELARWDWRGGAKYAAAGCAAVLGLASFALVTPAFSVNTLQQTQQYAARRIPATAVVVTEQSIGDLISQPWCTVEAAAPCLRSASYVITWRTYLQSSFAQGDPAFHQLMNGAVRITSFSGAVGTATIWRVRQAP